ncbi:MAG: XRE family transcriptional regulator [Candidatus Omnitrophota bacterium]|jgi:ribosome-binding protein aMBF1 (putative translation factor)|nr:MAG: XRE family transcriptional regulator [Candidatus Omnitrophota bacterium]
MSDIKGTDAAEYIRIKFGDYPDFEKGIEEERMKCKIGQMIYDARTEANLSQETLAEMVRVEPDMIARLEEADFEEIPFSLLQKIAKALSKRIEMHFVPCNIKTVELQLSL